MSLLIRKLELLAVTSVGNFGATLPFGKGLNIISARNTSGKSTCMMAILYALGLEGMLGPNQQPPLTDAMTRSILEGEDEYPVVESRVRLEIENSQGKILTVQRRVTGSTAERQLLRCTSGPAITLPNAEFPVRDFYVRIKGAARDLAGFHRFLADFIGYELPDVPVQDESTMPLYLECLMPYFFVDQLTGWRDLKSRMPTYLRVPEMAKRSAEFILDLDILKLAIKRQKIEIEVNKAKDSWARALQRARDVLGGDQALLRGIPNEPTAVWPPEPSPQILITDGQNWVSINTAIENLRNRVEKLVGEEIPKAEEVSLQVIEQLRTAEEEVSRLTDLLHSGSKDLMSEKAHLESIRKRLHALFDDMRQYQEWKKVQDRGGDIHLETSNGRCPCCHQSIKDTLLEQTTAASPMTLEQNIAFLRDQIATFRDMFKEAEVVVEVKEKQVATVGQRIEEASEQVRALRRTLRTDGRLPSIAAVQEHLHVEQRMRKLEQLKAAASKLFEDFSVRAVHWARIQSERALTSDSVLTSSDQAKLLQLQILFLQQLREYDFQSFPIGQIEISHESYRPSRDGYDIGLTSASDTIRIIWAYLIAMLEVSSKFSMNHLGLLVFDEPRQQGAEKLSFDKLLHRAAHSSHHGHQIIFATSEDKEVLEGIIKDIECNYQHFEGRILARV